ncbi:MAG: sulfatase-like hydrolase/transferase, partial [Endomicrobium sp.]|nr:sulfatase-like hydrolase/transferase [Endomicrobium sp.]
IGEFIKTAKKENFFDDTIFIFMADHTQGYTCSLGGAIERFRIPFIIYAPKIFKPQKINWAVSQADVIPTIYALMGFDGAFSAAGVDALDKGANHFALLNDGDNIILVEDENYIMHNRKKVIDSSLGENNEEAQKMSETLLSLDKAITESFRKNIWYLKQN